MLHVAHEAEQAAELLEVRVTGEHLDVVPGQQKEVRLQRVDAIQRVLLVGAHVVRL